MVQDPLDGGEQVEGRAGQPVDRHHRHRVRRSGSGWPITFFLAPSLPPDRSAAPVQRRHRQAPCRCRTSAPQAPEAASRAWSSNRAKPHGQSRWSTRRRRRRRHASGRSPSRLAGDRQALTPRVSAHPGRGDPVRLQHQQHPAGQQQHRGRQRGQLGVAGAAGRRVVRRLVVIGWRHGGPPGVTGRIGPKP